MRRRCRYRRGGWRCPEPVTVDVEAGTPGTGHYYSAGACDLHEQQVVRSARQATRGAPVRTSRVEPAGPQQTVI
jgi:hypothetical protein